MTIEAVGQESGEIVRGLLMLFSIVVVVLTELHVVRRQDEQERRISDLEDAVEKLEISDR